MLLHCANNFILKKNTNKHFTQTNQTTEPADTPEVLHDQSIHLPSFYDQILSDATTSNINKFVCYSYNPEDADSNYYIGIPQIYDGQIQGVMPPHTPLLYCNTFLCNEIGQNASKFCTIRDIVIAPKNANSPQDAKIAAEGLARFIDETYQSGESVVEVVLAGSDNEVDEYVKASERP